MVVPTIKLVRNSSANCWVVELILFLETPHSGMAHCMMMAA